MNTIELLESRIALSVTAALNGNVLLIEHVAASGADNLQIMQNAAGEFEVTDSSTATNYGTFTAKSIDIRLGETADDVLCGFSGKGLAGKLTIETGDGGGSINLTSAATAGRINGAVTVHGGAGADSLFLNNLALKKTLTFHGEGDTDYVNGSGFTVGKTVFIENVENTTFAPSAPVVFGALDIDQDGAVSDVTFFISNIVAIKKKLTYCGTPTFMDTVTVVGQVGGKAKLMLDTGTNHVFLAARMSSALNIIGEGGDDEITFTDTATATMDPMLLPNNISTVAKAVKINLGEGTNSLTLQKGAHFYNSLTLNTGNGADLVNFGEFFLQKNLTLNLGGAGNAVKHIEGTHGVQGKFNYAGLGGDDSVTLTNVVAGTLKLKLGDGTNDVIAASGVQILGKKVSIFGGAGADTIDIGINSSSATFKALLFGGTDALTYSGGGLAKAILNGGSGSDSLVGASLLPASSMTISFESTLP